VLFISLLAASREESKDKYAQYPVLTRMLYINFLTGGKNLGCIGTMALALHASIVTLHPNGGKATTHTFYLELKFSERRNVSSI
jgi:hypothetical protein